jgi:hypothetical protein
VREGLLELHPGTAQRRRPVEKHPATTFALAGGSNGRTSPDEDDRVEVEVTAGPDGQETVTVRLGGPRILGTLELDGDFDGDLEGDGGDEIVVYRSGRPGGVITVLSPR